MSVLQVHDDRVWCVKFDKKRLVSGDSRGVVKVWDLQAALDSRSLPSAICNLMLTEHGDSIWDMQFDGRQLVSASEDRSILIRDFSLREESEAWRGSFVRRVQP